MKYFRCPLYLIVIFSLCCQALASDDSTSVNQVAGPQLVFEEERFDFGTIEPGQVVDHVFQFRNVGLDTLHIKKVTSG